MYGFILGYLDYLLQKQSKLRTLQEIPIQGLNCWNHEHITETLELQTAWVAEWLDNWCGPNNVPNNPFISMDYLLRIILNSSNYGCCTQAQNKDDLLVHACFCLLAPKVLLDYLQPMITNPIRPTYSSESSKQALDWSEPTSNDLI